MHECMQINEYHAVALHLTWMGTLRISGVNATHGFEQAVFLGRLSNMFIEVCPNENILEGCPQYHWSLSK